MVVTTKTAAAIGRVLGLPENGSHSENETYSILSHNHVCITSGGAPPLILANASSTCL